MRVIVLGVAAIALAGCAGLGSLSVEDTTYIRTDGQVIEQTQIDADLSTCPSGFFSRDRTSECMVAKGYFLVAVNVAEAKRAQFAQITEEKRRQEQARILAERKKQEELERAARRKGKKAKQPVLRQ
jgi:hypothetical protein